jgi:hypothetical protein
MSSLGELDRSKVVEKGSMFTVRLPVGTGTH